MTNDFMEALESTPVLNREEVSEVLLEIKGEAEFAYWHWVVRLTDGTYAYARGWRDYSGWFYNDWDSTNSLEMSRTESLEEAFRAAGPSLEKEFYDMVDKGIRSRPYCYVGY